MSEIKLNSPLANSYFTNLKNRIFKILPLTEEGNDGVVKYANSLLFELNGIVNVIDGIENQCYFLSLLGTLESVSEELLAPDIDLECVRSEILKCLNIIQYNLQKGE